MYGLIRLQIDHEVERELFELHSMLSSKLPDASQQHQGFLAAVELQHLADLDFTSALLPLAYRAATMAIYCHQAAIAMGQLDADHTVIFPLFGVEKKVVDHALSSWRGVVFLFKSQAVSLSLPYLIVNGPKL
ncbi:MAG: hypothetical protein ACRCZE_02410 [Candidatus Altimarinota bacterium]